MIDCIRDKELRKVTSDILYSYKTKIEKLPGSLSGHHHIGETHMEHLRRTFFFAKEIVREFNLKQDESDVLLASALLHDIGLYEFTTNRRNKDEFQKLYVTGWNRSQEVYKFHPTLGMFLIGRKMLDMGIINGSIIRTALTVSTHMNHWLSEYNFVPQDKIGEYLALADYLASRKGIKLDE